MFDLGFSFNKLLIIGVLAAFLLGPDRLPQLASQLARLVRSLREMASGAKDRLKDDMGEEYNEVDWKKLDPRQYDPRRIIREALSDDAEVPAASAGAGAGTGMGTAAAAAGTAAGAAAATGSAGSWPGASGPAASGPRIDESATVRLRAIMAGEPVEHAPFDPDAT
ncbi:hypothetical protein [Mycetocola tolaasinivorans]|uniref:hypothetical protein n=1 Tax=Mycetocola tolaasinivorans TaxID=76635 RepID=UPI001C7DC0BF